jgi:predicted permease
MGNMGLPICLFAFGEEGLALAIVLFTVNVIGHFTFGMGIARGRADLRGLARLPLVYAVVLGLLLVFADLRLPLWIGNTLNLLGGLTIPLMLLALGVMSVTWMSVVAVLVAAQRFLAPRAAIDVPLALAIIGFGALIVFAPESVPGLVARM